MIVVVATMLAKPGMENELEQVIKSVLPMVQQEEGTVSYTLNRSWSDPRCFVVYEKYKDQKSLESHASTSYLKDMSRASREYMDGKAKIEIFEEIASIDR